MDRLWPLLLFALGLLSSAPPPFGSEPRPPTDDVTDPVSTPWAEFGREEEEEEEEVLLRLPMRRETHLCASTALCSSDSLCSSRREGMAIPRSSLSWSSLFCRSCRTCRAFSVSSTLASWSSRSWCCRIRDSRRGRQPRRFSSPRTYTDDVSWWGAGGLPAGSRVQKGQSLKRSEFKKVKVQKGQSPKGQSPKRSKSKV